MGVAFFWGDGTLRAFVAGRLHSSANAPENTELCTRTDGSQAKDTRHVGPRSFWTRGPPDPSKAMTVPPLLRPAAGRGRAPQDYTSGPLNRGGRGAGQEAR